VRFKCSDPLPDISVAASEDFHSSMLSRLFLSTERSCMIYSAIYLHRLTSSMSRISFLPHFLPMYEPTNAPIAAPAAMPTWREEEEEEVVVVYWQDVKEVRQSSVGDRDGEGRGWRAREISVSRM